MKKVGDVHCTVERKYTVWRSTGLGGAEENELLRVDVSVCISGSQKLQDGFSCPGTIFKNRPFNQEGPHWLSFFPSSLLTIILRGPEQ